MSFPVGPIYIRTEDGALFNPGNGEGFQTLRWEWIRLEDGTDLLVGPAGLAVDATVTARMQAGDVDVLQSGHAT